MRSERAIGTRLIALLTDALGKIEHDRDRKAVMRACQLDERLARLRLDVGRVDDRELHRSEALRGDEVKELERVFGGRLIVRIV